MVAYHILFDISFFNVYERLDLTSSYWKISGSLIAGTFFFIVGLSLYISFSRSVDHLEGAALWWKYLRRGLKIFFYGIIISSISWWLFPQSFIAFGALHFIGTAIILGFVILYYFDPEIISLLAISLGVILLGLVLSNHRVNFPWMVWIGLVPKNFTSLDFFPLIPWFGAVLLGISAGKQYYPGGRRKVDLSKKSLLGPLCFVGRNSLLVYFLHQPLILGVLFFLNGTPPAGAVGPG